MRFLFLISFGLLFCACKPKTTTETQNAAVSAEAKTSDGTSAVQIAGDFKEIFQDYLNTRGTSKPTNEALAFADKAASFVANMAPDDLARVFASAAYGNLKGFVGRKLAGAKDKLGDESLLLLGSLLNDPKASAFDQSWGKAEPASADDLAGAIAVLSEKSPVMDCNNIGAIMDVDLNALAALRCRARDIQNRLDRL